MTGSQPIFRQLFDSESSTYTYILGDPITKDAIIIDPVLEKVNRDMELVKEMGLNLKFALNTHAHADHITGSGLMKKQTNFQIKSVIGKHSSAQADIHLEDGDIFTFGKQELLCLSTPGHTNGCFTYVSHSGKMVFTGDCVLIRGCGRTDFQEGSSETLYDSVHLKIFTLPDDYIIYPAHDYTGRTASTVREEKLYNPRLTKSKEEFVKIMSALNLPKPKKIDEAVPANLKCGLQD